MKKLVSILIAALLLVSALPVSGALAEGESVTLSVLAPYFSSYDPADTPVQKEYIKKLSEQLGYDVTLEYTFFGWAAEYQEKLNIAVNAADLPWDIIGLQGLSGSDGTFQGGATNVNSLGKKGYFANLKDYDTPNLDRLLAECGQLVDYMYDEDGNIYFSPMFSENQGGTCNPSGGIVIDKTVFDENNIAYPTTPEALLEAARQLKEIYPDSYPVLNRDTGAGGIWSNINEKVFPCHRWVLGFNGTEYTVDGTTQAFRDAVSYVNKIYEDGLIAPDYAAWDQDMIKAQLNSGKSFIFLNQYLDGGSKLSDVPGVEGHEYINISYALAENNGGWWSLRGAMTKYSANTWGMTAINAQSKHVKEAVAVLDATLSDEIHNLLALGFEGQSWDYDADGNKVFIGEYLTASGDKPEENPKMALGVSVNGLVMSGLFPAFGVTNTNGLGENTYIGFLMPDGTVEYANPYTFASEHWTYENMEPENSVDVSLPSITAEEREYVAEVTDPLYTYMSESFAKFVTGEMDIDDDATWQAYLDECNTYDIEGICAIYNKYIEGKQMYNK